MSGEIAPGTGRHLGRQPDPQHVRRPSVVTRLHSRDVGGLQSPREHEAERTDEDEQQRIEDHRAGIRHVAGPGGRAITPARGQGERRQNEAEHRWAERRDERGAAVLAAAGRHGAEKRHGQEEGECVRDEIHARTMKAARVWARAARPAAAANR